MVKLYLLELNNDISTELFDMLIEHISPENKNRIFRSKNIKKAHQQLISELLVRYLAMTIMNTNNENFTIHRDEFGKPYIPELQSFHFNYSNSRKWIACAVSDLPVGVDIEFIREISLGLAKRFFTPKEYEYITGAPDNLQLQYFYDLWSLKEAYVKMLGTGFRVGLHEFSICIEKASIHVESAFDTMCFFQKMNPIENYALALCTKGPEPDCPVVLLHEESFLLEFLKLVNK